MCAALSAVEQGARVLLVERGPERDRGGNSKYTRNIRCASDVYPEAELFSDLVGVTGEEIDLELARFAIAQSREAPAWMESHGVRWQPAFRGTMHLDRTNKFFLGGGKALLNVYYRELAARGIPVRYDTRLTAIERSGDDGFTVTVEHAGGSERISARALAIASGGYESNYGWLEREWGAAARQFIIRGTSGNDGAVLQLLFDLGAEPRGQPARVPRDRRGCALARATTAGSSPASTRSRTGSWSTSTPGASTTRASRSGRSATRSGAG